MTAEQMELFMKVIHKHGAGTVITDPAKLGNDCVYVLWQRADERFHLNIDKTLLENKYGIRDTDDRLTSTLYRFSVKFGTPSQSKYGIKFPKRMLMHRMSPTQLNAAIDYILCEHLERQLAKGE
jgi:hypothetical protein